MLKKIIGFLCSVIFCTTIAVGMPQMVKAAEVILSGECGEDANYELIKKSNETYILIISGTGAIDNYGINSTSSTANEYNKLPKAPWQNYLISEQNYINEIIINEGITRIGTWNFAGSKATKYSLPNTLKEIGYQAFRTGIHQDELILPSSVETIEDYAFNGIGSSLLENWGADAGYVKKIVLPVSLRTIGEYAFSSCDKLEEVEINGDTEIHSYAFYLCQSLISVKMNGNVTRAKKAGGEFYDCRSLENVYLSDTYYWEKGSGLFDNTFSADESNAHNGTFENSLKLKNIIISSTNLYYKSVNGILYTKDCKKLIACPPALEINECYVLDGTEKIERYAFKQQQNIEYIYLPNSVIEISSGSFKTDALKYVVLSENITEIPRLTFYDNDSLSIYVPSSVTKTYFNEGKLWNDSFGSLDKRTITIYGDSKSYVSQNYSDVFKEAIYCKFVSNGKIIEKKVLFPGYKYGKLPELNKEGYEFLGWYTKDVDGEKIEDTSLFSGDKSIQLYAHWRAKNVISDNHIFSDYDYTIPVTGSAIIYGNGMNKKIDGKRVNNKALTVYTDILASYKHTPNSNGTVKSSVGKVIVAVTKTAEKPTVSIKNKVTDTSASKIAKARIKNGQITVTAVGKEGGLAYLWAIDTGNKGVSACCPIDVKLAPKKLEIQDTAGSKLKNTKLANDNTIEVCVAGFVGSAKTDDCTYTATIDSKYQSYITVTPVDGSTNKFTIKGIGLKNNKDTKAVVTFKCDQNGKKTNFSLTITK